MFVRSVLYAAAFMVACVTSTALAEDTPLSVSILSKDAKFIGTSMGGVRVTIARAGTGEVLARGQTRGSTGDTALIMADERGRDQVLRTEGSARFDTVIDIDQPTPVTVTAHGPLAQPQAAKTMTQQRLLIPGKDYSAGNGILLTMPGMAVDVLDPPAHAVRQGDMPVRVPVAVNAVKLCGCPLRDIGPWPVERYQVEAHIYRDGDQRVGTVPLSYTGETSQFGGEITFDSPGVYEIAVTVFDPATKDGGVDRTTVIVR